MLALVLLAAIGWPQLLGPDRNGVSAEVIAPWKSKPRLLWQKEVGEGFAGPAIAEGKLLLFHRVSGKERLDAMDLRTGKVLWTFESPTGYRDDFGFDEGPRSVPTVANGRVFTFGAEGMLHGIDLATGRKLWAVDTFKTFGVRKGFFGAACAPLVYEDRVLVNVGGADAGIVAFDAKTGKTLWTATRDEAGYSSPALAKIGGAMHALFLTRAGFVDLDPATGKVFSQYPWRSRSNASVNAATPLAIGDSVFLSASYGTGAVLLDLKDGKPKPVWQSDDAMSNHYATSVYYDGHLYGYHGRQEQGPSLRCIELRTGKTKWDVDQFRAGSLMLAGTNLLIQREGGEVVLAPATPAGYKPAAKFDALPATVRAYPALSDGVYCVRNEKMLACIALR